MQNTHECPTGVRIPTETTRKARELVGHAELAGQALHGDDEATVEQRQAASMFLCWPMNMIELAKKDTDLPKLVVELAKFIARREKLAVEAAVAARKE